MSKVLNIIRDEHRSIAAVLHGMQYLVNEIRTRKTKIDPRVFRAMLYYLDTFCDRMHHPKEDRYLFGAMRRRGARANALIAELEKEHAGGEESLRRLEQLLLRYEEGGDGEFPAFAREAENFVQGYWDHMRKEEEQVFPLAEKLLAPEDWAAIDRAFEENQDPLADQRDTEDFQKLFSRIVNLAPPPIGVGPAA
ncbi:MAG TPA: hemerythrin domain-containing protein [Burkholderiales bacterium]|nr:hemerythrin domain-containing protein [Burkholderiales bacterium]